MWAYGSKYKEMQRKTSKKKGAALISRSWVLGRKTEVIERFEIVDVAGLSL